MPEGNGIKQKDYFYLLFYRLHVEIFHIAIIIFLKSKPSKAKIRTMTESDSVLTGQLILTENEYIQEAVV